jgi:hypothetical protein
MAAGFDLRTRGAIDAFAEAGTGARLILGLRSRGEGGVGGDATAPDQEVDRYEAVRQYSNVGIVGVWPAAAVPMGLLAWVVASWLADQLG